MTKEITCNNEMASHGWATIRKGLGSWHRGALNRLSHHDLFSSSFNMAVPSLFHAFHPVFSRKEKKERKITWLLPLKKHSQSCTYRFSLYSTTHNLVIWPHLKQSVFQNVTLGIRNSMTLEERGSWVGICSHLTTLMRKTCYPHLTTRKPHQRESPKLYS